ncbi:MAG TPA: PIN domain-containing protein [Chthoniobacteraceae bacterium]|nr:PIN domain-containing protein [Chthoniobacteraceae bacterium]
MPCGISPLPVAWAGRNCMRAELFCDSNILLYAASNAPEDAAKRTAAREVLARPGVGFSAQVLQEFYVNATLKRGLRLSHEEAIAILGALRGFPILPVAEELVFAALEVKVRYQVSYWDAAIIAAAEALGARELYTEDLNAGQVYGSVRVVNPFK